MLDAIRTRGTTLRARLATTRVPRGVATLALLLTSLPTLPHRAAAQSPGVVVGSVVDPSGAPVHGAEVRIAGAPRAALTDERGRFRLDGVAPGTVRVTVRRLGFEPASQEASAPAGAAARSSPSDGGSVRITLTPLPTMLQPVRVVAARVSYAGRLAGYYRRLERNNAGEYITRAMIDHEDPRLLSHVFGRIAGVSVGRGRFGASTVRFRGRNCAPLVWLDGSPMPVGEVDLDAISPQSIHGIELYLGSTTAPAQYTLTRNANSCGTILLWSRGPDTDPIAPTPRTAEELERLVATRAVYTADQVDERATPTATAPIPAYPPSLAAAGGHGAVVAEFVVDAAGRVEPETFGIASSTNALLSEAVERAVLATTFKPAIRKGLAVRQLVQQPFDFTPPRR